MNTRNTVCNIKESIPEEQRILNVGWRFSLSHELLQRSVICILQDEVIQLAMTEATVVGSDVRRRLSVPPQLQMRITLGLVLFFSLWTPICLEDEGVPVRTRMILIHIG